MGWDKDFGDKYINGGLNVKENSSFKSDLNIEGNISVLGISVMLISLKFSTYQIN